MISYSMVRKEQGEDKSYVACLLLSTKLNYRWSVTVTENQCYTDIMRKQTKQNKQQKHFVVSCFPIHKEIEKNTSYLFHKF